MDRGLSGRYEISQFEGEQVAVLTGLKAIVQSLRLWRIVRRWPHS